MTDESSKTVGTIHLWFRSETRLFIIIVVNKIVVTTIHKRQTKCLKICIDQELCYSNLDHDSGADFFQVTRNKKYNVIRGQMLMVGAVFQA